MKEKNSILTLQDIRNNNTSNLMNNLVTHGTLSLRQLSQLCNTSVVTLGKIVDAMVKKGVVIATPKPSDKVGRHGMIYSINENLGCFVCINVVNVNKIGVILYNLSAKAIESFSEEYAKGKLESTLDLVIDKAKQFSVENNIKIIGVSLAVPGKYNEATDSVRYSGNPEIEALHFADKLKTFDTDNVTIDNHVNFSAYAESIKTFNTENESMYYMYIGRSVSGSIIKGQTMFTGVDGLGGTVRQALIYADKYTYMSDLIDNKLFVTEKGEVNYDAIRPIAVTIHNLIWLINPYYFVINSTNNDVSNAVLKEVNKLLERYQKGEITTVVSVSEEQNSSYVGMVYRAESKYLLNI